MKRYPVQILTFVLCSLSILQSATAQQTRFADALATVNCDESCWMRYATAAQARQFGVSMERLLEAWPGLSDQTLPKQIGDAIDAHLGSIQQWSTCLSDERATQIGQLDMLGNRVSNGRSIAVNNAAIAVQMKMIPQGLIRPDDASNLVLRMKVAALAWKNETADLNQAEIIALWYRRASDPQRLQFMNLALQFDIKPAFPIIEKRILERAESPDAFLELEVACYCRHRRNNAANFLKKFYERHPGTTSSYEHFRNGNERLVGAELAELLDRYLETGVEDFATLLHFSVDRPWAYHSMTIEPVSMSKPILQQQLKQLIKASVRTKDHEKRMVLVKSASSVVETLREVIARSSHLDNRKLAGPGDSSLKGFVANLHLLLSESIEPREYKYLLTSIETETSKLVWNLWGPNSRHMDVLFRGVPHDWRGRAIDLHFGSTNSILLEAAGDILDQTIGKAGKRPEMLAQKLIVDLGNGTARQWRLAIDQLVWEERLLLVSEIQHDKKFAKQMSDRCLVWLDLTPLPDTPSSFTELWTSTVQDKPFNPATVQAIENWLASEARSDRYWRFAAASRPDAPGLSACIVALDEHTKANIASDDTSATVARVTTSIDTLGFRTESAKRIGPDGLSLMKNNDSETNQSDAFQKFLAAKDQLILGNYGLQVSMATSRSPTDSKPR